MLKMIHWLASAERAGISVKRREVDLRKIDTTLVYMIKLIYHGLLGLPPRRCFWNMLFALILLLPVVLCQLSCSLLVTQDSLSQKAEFACKGHKGQISCVREV